MEINYRNETLEQKRKRLLEILYELRDGYSSEIPERIVHSTDENIKYKVRASWFGMVWLYFDGLFRGDLIPRALIQKRDEVMQNVTTRLKLNKGLTSRLDIEEVDRLLTDAIDYLESQ